MGAFGTDKVDKAAGEHYKAPGDEIMGLQRNKAIEEPGVLAGYSHVAKLPKLTGCLVVPWKGYAYAPLTRRLDNGRLPRPSRQRTVLGCVSVGVRQTNG